MFNIDNTLKDLIGRTIESIKLLSSIGNDLDFRSNDNYGCSESCKNACSYSCGSCVGNVCSSNENTYNHNEKIFSNNNIKKMGIQSENNFIKQVNVKTVTLILTNNCNLHCSYCFEKEKSNVAMSIEQAIKIIDYEMTKKDNFDFVIIDFFGGEPFLEFDTIKEIVQFVCKAEYDKPYVIFSSTNGTLIHGETQKWLKDHVHCFQLGLSFDGIKEMHDINRDNSFDNIDLKFFVDTYPKQGVKMTISQESLPKLFECVKFGHECNFSEIHCNLAFSIDWSNETNKYILETELKKLIEFYLINHNLIPCSMLNKAFDIIAHKKNNHISRKWCGCGTHMFTYDVDGKSFPCQFFTPSSCGEEKSANAKNLFFTPTIPLNVLDEKCKDCLIEMVCPTCYGANYAETGNLYKKDRNLCELTKIIVKARSYFKAKQWEKGLINLSGNEEKRLLESILKIQEVL